jgi:hypothetical protein
VRRRSAATCPHHKRIYLVSTPLIPVGSRGRKVFQEPYEEKPMARQKTLQLDGAEFVDALRMGFREESRQDRDLGIHGDGPQLGQR